jgi:hypothetical protein
MGWDSWSPTNVNGEFVILGAKSSNNFVVE